MMQNSCYQYFVEGKCERKIVEVLKSDCQAIIPGKVEVFNVVEKELSAKRMMALRKGTIVILIFDTDTDNTKILDKNIDFLKSQKMVGKVICVT